MLLAMFCSADHLYRVVLQISTLGQQKLVLPLSLTLL